MISPLLNALKDLSARIKKNTSVNVNSMLTKQAAIDAASLYFKQFRSEVVGIFGDAQLLQEYDKDWQHLIRLAHGNNSKRTYENLIAKLIKTTKELNIKAHSTITDASALKLPTISYSEAEKILLETLQSLLPSAAASYRQAIADLDSQHPRASYRGPAVEFREVLREVLDHFAPDDAVMNESWFKPERDQNRPTMKQKVKFILTSRQKLKSQRTAAEKTVELIEALLGDITKAVYDRASLSTHVETTKDEVIQLKRYLDALLFDLLAIPQTSF